MWCRGQLAWQSSTGIPWALNQVLVLVGSVGKCPVLLKNETSISIKLVSRRKHKLVPQTTTAWGNFKVVLKQLGSCTSPLFLSTLAPSSSNKMQNLHLWRLNIGSTPGHLREYLVNNEGGNFIGTVPLDGPLPLRGRTPWQHHVSQSLHNRCATVLTITSPEWVPKGKKRKKENSNKAVGKHGAEVVGTFLICVFVYMATVAMNRRGSSVC